MNIWKYAVLPLSLVLFAGCAQKKVAAVYPPLIVADAIPLVSKSKRSIGVTVNFENIAHDNYQYARFKLTAFDSAGNSIRPKKGNRDSAYVRLAGPIAPGQTRSTTWTNTWANKDIKCISLDEVELIFPDGSIELASNSRLLSKQEGNSCI
jgi:hypothetical protein